MMSSTVLLALLPLLFPAQAVNEMWRALDLPNDKEILEMMTTYQMQEYEDRTRGLSSRSGSQVNLGERCGNRNACSEEQDLQCTTAVLGKRCLPKNCLQQGLEQFQAEFDMQEYKQTTFQHAGVTEVQIQQKLQEETGGQGDKISFLQSDVFQAIKGAMDQHSTPADALFRMYDQCITNVNGTQSPYDFPRVNYQGLHIEGGLLWDGAVSFLWDVATGAAFVRYCTGFGGGGGFDISFIYLIAQMTSDVNAIANTCTVRADVNFGLPVNFRVGFGRGLSNGLIQIELAAGLGISIAAGVGFCGVSKN